MHNLAQRVIHVPQVVEDLSHFVGEYVNPEQYEVWVQQFHTSKLLKVNATIIGESHVINIDWCGYRIAEVIACTQTCKGKKIKSFGRLASFRQLKIISGNFIYKLQREIDTIDQLDHQITNINDQIVYKKNSQLIGLSQTFPALIKGDREPKTLVLVTQKDYNTIMIHSVHEYLPQGKAAITTTLIQRI